MKRNLILVLGLAIMSLLSNGCTSRPGAMAIDENAVALAVLGPAVNPIASEPGVFYLGAGDALGQAVFANYIAFVRANGPHADWLYASGEMAN
jgi:hypothetical protein